jgi:N-methylhydantoinase B/oxoprolinase/acetone carboxylase alpha subunit
VGCTGGQRGEMTQALYAHMNNKKIKIKKKEDCHLMAGQAKKSS